MRQLQRFPTLRWLVILILAVSLPAPLPALAEATPQPTPGEDKVPEGFTSNVLASVAVTGEDDEYLGEFIAVELTVAGGAEEPEPHIHAGTFFLSVMSGTICFSHYGVVGADAKVIVQTHGNVLSSTGTCSANVTEDCLDADGCVLKSGDVIELPAESFVVQTGAARHSYGNADDAMPAVLHLSGFVVPPDGSPCAGTCWRW